MTNATDATMDAITAQIEEVYTDSLINGALTKTTTVTKSPKGEITESVTVRRAIVPKDCLEYLRVRAPERWNPPPPEQSVRIKQETLNIGIDAIRTLLTPIGQE